MSTSMLTTALLNAVIAGGATPDWQTDYYRSQELSAVQKKPMAIVFGKGSAGWNQVAADGRLTAAALQVLADKYLCVYLDTATADGQALAKAVNVQGGVGFILGDRTGERQAFWHQGQLGNLDMVRYLEKYADTKMVVSTTERHSTARTSFYPTESSERTGTGAATTADPFCST